MPPFGFRDGFRRRFFFPFEFERFDFDRRRRFDFDRRFEFERFDFDRRFRRF
jgi:hypothetical protein